MDKLFGSGKNKALSTQDKETRDFKNSLLADLGKYSSGNIGTLNDYASNMYNPYDEAAGDAAFGALRQETEFDRQKQIDAVRGGPLNRFSLASNSANNNINALTRKNVNELNMQQLGMEVEGRQTGYGNQMGALAQLLGLGGSLAGQQNVQNQAQAKPGWIDRASKVAGLAQTGAQTYAML